MTLKSRTTSGHAADLQQFTLDFFTHFGATVAKQGRKKQSPYAVTLPEKLAGHFKRTDLQICFHQAALEPGLELVTQGSRIFDRMMAFLDQYGAMTHLQLPSRHAGSEVLLRAIQPVNVAITGLKMQEQQDDLYVFNWRITYRADDKREELYTVLLDEAGSRVSQPGEERSGAHATDITQLYADAQPVPLQHNEDGQLIPPRLPPMTQLTRLAEQARKYVIYHADVQCVSHEAEILPRLYKALNRLTSYYQQQAEETYDAHDPDGEKRQVLDDDLRRKIAEEVENHRLRVDVKLISYAVIQVPVAVANITLSNGARGEDAHETSVSVRLNRYDGTLQRPTCHACGEETTTLAVDRNGHITCDACLCQCAACQEILCAECGVAACPVCAKENCATCGRLCWACGERACADHIDICPVCRDDVCHACQAACAHCGVRQCRGHLRADNVAAAHGVTELICTDCAVRCPSCEQYSTHIGTCSASGQRFCENCLVACAVCERALGPGFYQLVGDQPYCSDCLTRCPACQSITAMPVACAECGELCCETCGRICSECGKHFCAQHAQASANCEHVLCSTHAVRCHLCANAVCPTCEPACGICGRHFCLDDSTQCQHCSQLYCRDCVRRTGLCDTCSTFHRTGRRINLATERCAADPKVARLAHHFRWTYSQNERYLIYIGEGGLATRMVIVADKRHEPPKVVTLRKSAPLDALRGKLWR